MANRICSVNGCNKSSHYSKWGKRGFCANHYALWRKHGDPTIKKCRPNGFGTITKHGYKIIYVNGKQVREHKYIMEQYLGRKLVFPKEVVHHKNGNPIDNRIENLEVKTQANHISDHFLTCKRTSIHKTCSVCKETLPHARFSHCKITLDNLRSNCKSCQNKYNLKRLKTL